MPPKIPRAAWPGMQAPAFFPHDAVPGPNLQVRLASLAVLARPIDRRTGRWASPSFIAGATAWGPRQD